MGKRVVVALGGNALGNNLTEQMTAVKQTSKAIADLIEAEYSASLSVSQLPIHRNIYFIRLWAKPI